MTVSNQMTKKGMWIAALLVAVFAGTSSHASAAAIVLSGGDSADDWVAPTSYVAAFNMGASAVDETIQGVTFLGWPGSLGASYPSPPAGVTAVTVNSTAQFNYAVTLPYDAGSTNDQAMARMIKNGFHTGGLGGGVGPLKFTINGLANGTYRVDEFFMSGDANRPGMRFDINGVTVDTLATANALDSWLIQNTVVVSSNTIVLDIYQDNALVPLLEGFVISAVPAPEPSGFLLLTIGGVCGLARLRKRFAR